MKLKNQKGLTLVEAVTSFMIVGFMAGGFMSILNLNATETSEGILSSQLQIQQDNVIEQISRDIRIASVVLDEGNGELFKNVDSYGSNQNNVKHVHMYDADGNITAGYQIQNNTLMELNTTTNTWEPYMSGNKQVSVTENSCFNLDGERKAVQIQIDVASTYKTSSDALTENSNYIQCRN